MARAKGATVFITATLADGDTCSGSGVLGVPDGRNLVLTNTRVVGMLSADSQPPRSVEVVVHHGRADEQTLPAEVLSADRASGLAVLDLGEAAGLPEPVSVQAAAGLREGADLQVLGYPPGPGGVREVSLSRTAVASLHTKEDELLRVEVRGGIDAGNSGGPVIDADGRVVGVADASGRQRHFVIPGERVEAVLNGCLAEMELLEPFAVPGPRVGVPVVLVMTDPRRRIREAAVDVWVGNRPSAGMLTRGPSQIRPPPAQGDQARVHCKLDYKDGRAQGDVVLPPLTGQSYWVQPRWIDGSGQPHWAAARAFIPAPPVTRTAAVLAFHPSPGASRTLLFEGRHTYRAGGDDEDDEGVVGRLDLRARFNEQVAATSATAATVRLRYQHAAGRVQLGARAHDLDVPAGILYMVLLLQFDARGELKSSALDPDMLQRGLVGAPQRGQERLQRMNEVHEPIKSGVETLVLPLPGRQVAPGETWTATRKVMVGGLGKERPARLELTCTYQGQRPGPRGADEAVLSLRGVLRGLPGRGKGGTRLAGTASGSAAVDVATGRVTRCELRLRADTELTVHVDGRPKTLRVLHVQSLGLRVDLKRVGG
jgi:hypothetical protein